MTETKSALMGVEVKSESLGIVEVQFATYNELDKHGDVTLNGAFSIGSKVLVSGHNHAVWGAGQVPVGKGVIKQGATGPIGELHYFMNTAAGREAFETVKAVGDQQQWSYGFDVVDSELGEHEGKSCRILKTMAVHEISPVTIGAGNSTATLSVKGIWDENKHPRGPGGRFSSMSTGELQEHHDSVTRVAESMRSQGRTSEARDYAETALAARDELHRRRNAGPETFGKGTDMSDTKAFGHDDQNDDKPGRSGNIDSKEKLAAAIRAAGDDEDARKRCRAAASKLDLNDMIPSSWSKGGDSGKMRMSDQVLNTVAVLKNLADRAEEIVTLRTAEGKKGLSDDTLAMIDLVIMQAERLKSVRSTPDPVEVKAELEMLAIFSTLEG